MNFLKGIKIVDFSRLLPGPLATRLMTQMGAEVIKIESPKRKDYARSTGKQIDGASILFHQLNYNKTFTSLDYETEAGKKALFKIIKNADVLLEQFRPGPMESWGLGYEEIKKINPNIVYVSVTGYGQKGSLAKEAGHDFNYLAISGIMSLMKDENGIPNVSDTQFADIGGAYMTVIAIQSALVNKLKTGEGSYVDVSLTDAVLPFLTVPFSFVESDMNYRSFNIINGKTAVNYAVYECLDGKYLSVAAMEIKFWNNVCTLLQRPDWIRQNQLELMNFSFPKKEVEAIFKTKSRDDWAVFFKGHDVCIAPILEIEELENHPYHIEKGNFEKIRTASGKKINTPRLPFRDSSKKDEEIS